MSEPTEKDDSPKPFSALSFGSPLDPGTLSLSDSDPALSDTAEVESISDEEEENDDDEDHGQEGRHEAPFQPFSLKGMDAGFSQRSDGIFGALLGIQKCSPLGQHNIKGRTSVTDSESPEGSPESVPTEQKEKTNTSSSSITTKKRPAPTSRLPDYLAHPERWTKYNLEDVPDTSDRANRNTALNFLGELKQQKEAKEVSKDTNNPLSFNQDSSSSGEGRILFSKPQKKNQKDSEKCGVQSGKQNMAGPWGDDGLEESEVLGEQAKPESFGFHGSKKRSRKNIRQKADDKEEEDSS